MAQCTGLQSSPWSLSTPCNRPARRLSPQEAVSIAPWHQIWSTCSHICSSDRSAQARTSSSSQMSSTVRADQSHGTHSQPHWLSSSRNFSTPPPSHPPTEAHSSDLRHWQSVEVERREIHLEGQSHWERVNYSHFLPKLHPLWTISLNWYHWHHSRLGSTAETWRLSEPPRRHSILVWGRTLH